MYFDYDFTPRSWVEDYIRNFINSRRDYQAPFKVDSVTLKQASTIFGESKEVLKKMSRQELVKLFRRKAQELHPDKGGDHEKFVDLTHAYHVLLSTKDYDDVKWQLFRFWPIDRAAEHRQFEVG